MLTPSPRIKVNRQGNCPCCEGRDLRVVQRPRPDRTVVRCSGCKAYSVRHSNGSQYPLEDPADPTSAPAVAIQHSE